MVSSCTFTDELFIPENYTVVCLCIVYMQLLLVEELNGFGILAVGKLHLIKIRLE